MARGNGQPRTAAPGRPWLGVRKDERKVSVQQVRLTELLRGDAYAAQQVQAMGGRKISVIKRRECRADANCTAYCPAFMAGQTSFAGAAVSLPP